MHSFKCIQQYFFLHLNVFRNQHTVKPVNKGHPRERQHMVLIDKWVLYAGFFVLFFIMQGLLSVISSKNTFTFSM